MLQILLVMFIVLKLLGLISWTWMVVLTPLWVILALAVIAVIIKS